MARLLGVLFVSLSIFLYFKLNSKIYRVNTIFDISLSSLRVLSWSENWSLNGDGEIVATLEITKEDYNKLAPIDKNVIIKFHKPSEDKVLIKYKDKSRFYLYGYYSIR